MSLRLMLLPLFLFAMPAFAGDLKQLSVTEVAQKQKEKNVYVFDNNNAERYAKGHVPGAKLLKYNPIDEKDLPADKTATLIFYCANEQCGACHKAAESALKLGYKNVYIMPSGIMGWEKAGLPTEKKS